MGCAGYINLKLLQIPDVFSLVRVWESSQATKPIDGWKVSDTYIVTTDHK
jgi:hypothetical protein